MNKLSLSDGEWKLMNLLWDECPRTIGGMVDALREDTALQFRFSAVRLHRFLVAHLFDFFTEFLLYLFSRLSVFFQIFGA